MTKSQTKQNLPAIVASSSKAVSPVETVTVPMLLTRGGKGYCAMPAPEQTPLVSIMGCTFRPVEHPAIYLQRDADIRWLCHGGNNGDTVGSTGANGQIIPDATGKGSLAMIGYQNGTKERPNHPVTGEAEADARSRMVTICQPGGLTVAATSGMRKYLEAAPGALAAEGKALAAIMADYGRTRMGGLLDSTGPHGNYARGL